MATSGSKTTLLQCLSLLACMVCMHPLVAAELFADRTFPSSVGMQMKTDTCDNKTINSIADLGTKWVRRGFYFDKVNPAKGTYVFDDYDRIMNEAEKRGMKVLGTLFGNNKIWEDDKKGGIQTAEGRKGFALFAAALAKQYKGRSIVWEVWNEPNIRTFWRKDKTAKHNSPEFAKEYTDLVIEVVKAMKKEDPDVFVMAGSASCFWQPTFNWTEECFKNGIGQCGIRAWSVHPYGLKTPEEFSAGYATMRSIMKKYKADHLLLLNSERGFTTKKNYEGWSGGDEKMAKEYQAWHVVRQFMMDQLNHIPLTIWYEWGAKDFGLGLPNKKNPSWYAYETMIDQLAGYTFQKRIDLGAALDFALLFEAKGQRKLVMWTAPPAKQTPNKFVAHEVKLPFKMKAAADIYGKSISVKGLGDSIQISAAPIYVSLK